MPESELSLHKANLTSLFTQPKSIMRPAFMARAMVHLSDPLPPARVMPHYRYGPRCQAGWFHVANQYTTRFQGPAGLTLEQQTLFKIPQEELWPLQAGMPNGV